MFLSSRLLCCVTYGLAQRSALSNCNLITLLNTERWADMRCQVLVSLLVSGVFRDKVKVFAADDEGSVHLCRNNSACQDTTTDGDISGEGAFLVCASLDLRDFSRRFLTLSHRCSCRQWRSLVS